MEEKKNGKTVKPKIGDYQAGEYITDAEADRASQSIRAKLNRQEKVPVVIMKRGENDDSNAEVTIGGVKFMFPKNKVVNVPVDVLRVLKSAYTIVEQSEKFAKANEMKDMSVL